jgi:hypothetical protein
MGSIIYYQAEDIQKALEANMVKQKIELPFSKSAFKLSKS